MKRILLVLLVLALSITLCSCGDDATTPNTVDTTTMESDNTDSDNTDLDNNTVQKELSEEERYLDNCAKAWAVCYASCPHFDERNISTIFYAKDNTAYSLMYGKDNVTIISNFLGTECTYIVSSELDETLSAHFPYFYNGEYKLYIHGIGTENFEKGWLKDGWDYVTDTYIMMAEMDCETMDVDTVKSYKAEHYKN